MAALSEPTRSSRLITLPAPRGPWTESLYALLDQAGELVPQMPVIAPGSALHDDDLQMALYLCYELHYSGLVGVDDRHEWSPVVLMFRAALETAFEDALRTVAPPLDIGTTPVGQVLQHLVRDDDGPPLSRYLETRGTAQQFLEHVIHRSAYQLKEADPHSWAIPRLTGAAKAALVEIQADEYGGGEPELMHSELFAETMLGLGLDAGYGAYIDRLPGITLATVTTMSSSGCTGVCEGRLRAISLCSR